MSSNSSEAGPSRIRRTSSHEPRPRGMNQDGVDGSIGHAPPRPASPSNIMPRSEGSGTGTGVDDGMDGESQRVDGATGTGSAGATSRQPETETQKQTPTDSTPIQHPTPPKTPYLDLATYPTQNLLRLLASLLQQIASANDQLRPEMQDEMDEDSSGRAGGGGGGRGTEEADMDDQKSSRSSTSGGTIKSTGAQPSRSHRESVSDSTSTGPSSTPASGSGQLHPSPTTELFTSDPSTPTGTGTGTGTSNDPNSARSNDQPQDPRSHVPQRKASLSPTTGRAEHLFTASKTSLTHSSSLLSFHARHIPSISIEAYLLRILKYCPTTNEVFLGLLVYFDRMSRLGTPGGLGGMMKGGKGFAIDSYNIHRLVIAGVTVASKFFSDVFYTNSRYAKVGGLPPHELNQLELQFLLLNDFRLVIPVDEMQRYGNRLLGYWENKEAEAAAAAAATSGSGVGAPSEDQIMAASKMIRSEASSGFGKTAPAPAPDPTPNQINTNTNTNNPNPNPNTSTNASHIGSPTSPADQARQQTSTPDQSERTDRSGTGNGNGNERDQRPSIPRQSTHPIKSDNPSSTFQPVNARRASYEDTSSSNATTNTNSTPSSNSNTNPNGQDAAPGPGPGPGAATNPIPTATA